VQSYEQIQTGYPCVAFYHAILALRGVNMMSILSDLSSSVGNLLPLARTETMRDRFAVNAMDSGMAADCPRGAEFVDGRQRTNELKRQVDFTARMILEISLGNRLSDAKRGSRIGGRG